MSEGCCGSCMRLVSLSEDGLITKHTVWYAEFGRWSQVPCKGTGLEPTEPEEAA